MRDNSATYFCASLERKSNLLQVQRGENIILHFYMPIEHLIPIIDS